MGAVPHADPACPGLSPEGPATPPRPCLCPQVEFSLDTLCPGPTRGWFQLLPFPSTTKDHG